MYPNCTNMLFRSGDIAFLTKHKKEEYVAPILEPFLGAKILKVDGYDTDLFGTFTREVKRVDSQIETARRKARKGIELAKTPMGIGSEGSFDMDPYYGLIPWNIELLVFIDEAHDTELVGVAEGPAKTLQQTGRTIEEIEGIAIDFGFPINHLTLRPDRKDNPYLVKSICTFEQLRMGVRQCLEMSQEGIVCVENDLRAYACPSRQEMIKLAAINLLLKMHSLCPSCHAPGFWVTGITKGLPCVYCGYPTDIMKDQIYGCLKCGHSKEIRRTDITFADQGSCAFCNP